MNFKKLCALLLCIALSVTMLAACGAPAEEAPAADAEAPAAEGGEEAPAGDFDGTIYWLNFKPEVAEQMQTIAAAYTEETGIDVKIETAAANTYDATLTAEMDKSDSPTIFVMADATGMVTWKDYLTDLSDTELYNMMSDQSFVLGDGDAVYGISYALESYGIIANKAILEAYFAMEGKATDVSSVEELYTFENLKAVVEDMQANKETLGIDGVFGSTSLRAGDDWRYQTHLMNVPMFWEFGAETDLSGTIPEFTFEYAENYKNILDLYLNNSVVEPELVGTKGVSDSMAELALGQCAMIQNGDWGWNDINGTAGMTVAPEDIIFIPITSGVEGEENMGLHTGAGQYMAINSTKSPEEQQAALDFLVWLFSSETGTNLVATELQFVAPFTAMAGATYENPLFASANEIAASGKTAYPWVLRLIPSQAWKDAFGADLLLYAQGQLDWDTVIANATASWEVEREITNEAAAG